VLNKIYREHKGKKIFGEVFYGIVKYSKYTLIEITVFSDGMIRCSYELIDFDTFKKKLKSGWIRVNLPENSELHVHNLGIINSREFNPAKTNEDFIKEIEDSIIEQNGGKGRSRKCIDLFKNYLLKDSEQNYMDLKNQFEDLPSHKKVLFEYVDYKDALVGLMKTEEKFSSEQRKYILNDYFENEWNEKEFE
jgi:hypothetical protein